RFVEEHLPLDFSEHVGLLRTVPARVLIEADDIGVVIKWIIDYPVIRIVRVIVMDFERRRYPAGRVQFPYSIDPRRQKVGTCRADPGDSLATDQMMTLARFLSRSINAVSCAEALASVSGFSQSIVQ